jgi:hypothetical protein
MRISTVSVGNYLQGSFAAIALICVLLRGRWVDLLRELASPLPTYLNTSDGSFVRASTVGATIRITWVQQDQQACHVLV